MRVMVLGATGRIGAAAVVAAQAAGHDVTALVRRSDVAIPGARLVVGSMDDVGVIQEALTDAEAVIAALGPRANDPAVADELDRGMRVLTAAMVAADVTRLVALSGAAVDVPGDRKPVIDRLAARIVRLAARHVVAAKQREFAVFSATDLAWTALRPAIAMDGVARGYRLSDTLTPGARTTRADVGQALVDQLDDMTFLRQSPFVLPPHRG